MDLLFIIPIATVSTVYARRFGNNDSTANSMQVPVPGGHFIREDIAAFDAPFFSLSAGEASAMDPQQRKLLETTYRALENGNLRPTIMPN
jgi:acyl transferase domain-containing protein